ncbi:hypothetical protein ABZY16_07990 [Streptomyces sp. NPDC006553]|uniref:hypothetical protein n=1 Tax=unclassified Streptomyces TaxID=2593676 RepID=UPI00224FCD0A|nr:hypothetical protein [Streptomyces sp. NBC_00233]MCX5232519.1 hypothetical protein [Streptomyces sp. NBC_00233]
MSASESSKEKQTRHGGSPTARPKAADAEATVNGTLTALPAPMAEKTLAAVQAVQGTVGRGGWIWSDPRARKALAGGAAAGTAAALTGAYALGLKAGRRRPGLLSRFTGGTGPRSWWAHR